MANCFTQKDEKIWRKILEKFEEKVYDAESFSNSLKKFAQQNVFF